MPMKTSRLHAKKRGVKKQTSRRHRKTPTRKHHHKTPLQTRAAILRRIKKTIKTTKKLIAKSRRRRLSMMHDVNHHDGGYHCGEFNDV